MTSKFQQRHYETVAVAIKSMREQHPDGLIHIDEVQATLALMFLIDNDRFKLERFISACRVEV